MFGHELGMGVMRCGMKDMEQGREDRDRRERRRSSPKAEGED